MIINTLEAFQFVMPTTKLSLPGNPLVEAIPEEINLWNAGVYAERHGVRKVNGEDWITFEGNTDGDHEWLLFPIRTRIYKLPVPTNEGPWYPTKDTPVYVSDDLNIGHPYVPVMFNTDEAIVIDAWFYQPALKRKWYWRGHWHYARGVMIEGIPWDCLGIPWDCLQLSEAFWGGDSYKEGLSSKWFYGGGSISQNIDTKNREATWGHDGSYGRSIFWGVFPQFQRHVYVKEWFPNNVTWTGETVL